MLWITGLLVALAILFVIGAWIVWREEQQALAEGSRRLAEMKVPMTESTLDEMLIAKINDHKQTRRELEQTKAEVSRLKAELLRLKKRYGHSASALSGG